MCCARIVLIHCIVEVSTHKCKFDQVVAVSQLFQIKCCVENLSLGDGDWFMLGFDDQLGRWSGPTSGN